MPDGKVWMVTSVDNPNGGGYSSMHSYHTFSSVDMKNWVDHGEVLHLKDVVANEPPDEDWALWAPDMIYRKGTYYLYFPIRILNTNNQNVTSYIAVAKSDRLDRRFTVLKTKIEGTSGIDPCVFVDDNGEVYLFWGGRWSAKLKDNMYELQDDPERVTIGADNFMEAIWIHKRQGTYYLSYHTKYDKPVDPNNPDDPGRIKSQLDYCMSDKLLGPYTYKGVMNYELGYNVKTGPIYPGKDYVPWRLTQSNHGGIVEFHGKEYLFYHTSALSSWKEHKFQKEGVWTKRSVCVDFLTYKADGTIIPVQQTIESVPADSAKQPFEIKLQALNAVVSAGIDKVGNQFNITGKTGTIQFRDIELGTGYYYFDFKVLAADSKCPIEVRSDNISGKLLGTALVDQSSPGINNGTAEIFLREAKGKRNIFLTFTANVNSPDLKVENFRFFAGSPIPGGTAIGNKYSQKMSQINIHNFYALHNTIITIFPPGDASLSLFAINGKTIRLNIAGKPCSIRVRKGVYLLVMQKGVETIAATKIVTVDR